MFGPSWVRHYSARHGHGWRRPAGEQVESALREALHDEAPEVRIEAAAALGASSEEPEALEVLVAALHLEQVDSVLHAIRAIELLGPDCDVQRADIETVVDRASREESTPNAHPCWMFVRFSGEAILEAMEDLKGPSPDCAAHPGMIEPASSPMP